MTDKVQKIREEVERLMYGFNLEADIASCEDAETEKLADIKYQLCKKILDHIDKVQEEPVSEDLEKEIRKYLVEYKGYPHVMDEAEKEMVKIARHFAKWQKEQMMKDTYDAYVSYIRDNSEAVVFLKNTSITMPSHFPKRDLEEGDKLKIVVIKED